MQIALTQKLQEYLGIKVLDEPVEQEFFLNDWIAHYFIYKKKKHFIFLNTKTLFCIMPENIKKNTFVLSFFNELLSELHKSGVKQEITDILKLDFNNVVYVKNRDRSLTSSLNTRIQELNFSADCNNERSLDPLEAFNAEFVNTRIMTSKNICKQYFRPVELLFEKLNLPKEQIIYKK